MKEQIILNMLEFLNQVKFQHWATYGYSTHQALGMLYDELSDMIDNFVETMMGKYGRGEFPPSFTIQITKPEDTDNTQIASDFAEYLISLSEQLDVKNDSDLLNDRDAMLGITNKIKYLLTLSK